MRCPVLFAFVATLVAANGAAAASLTVVADRTHYAVGATITLTVTGTICPTCGDAAPNIYVPLDLPANVSFVSSTADQALNPAPMFGAQTGWTITGTQGMLSGNSLTVFGQLCCLAPGGPFVNNAPPDFSSAFLSATVVLTADADGSAAFDFGVLTDFFDVDGASPGTSVTIGPEPLSGGDYQIHESAILPAAVPVMENVSGTLQLQLATLGRLAGGLSYALPSLQLQSGVMPVPEPAGTWQLGTGLLGLLMLARWSRAGRSRR